MKIGRITFPGNPWPEGHEIAAFKWTAKVVNGDVVFHFHLETAKYYAERDVEDDDSVENISDWEAPIVWGNFHNCTISSTEWHDKGFRLCAANDYSLDMLDGLELHVDPLPCDLRDHDKRAFDTYLLGHDTVVDHHIAFERIKGTDLFNISWRGKIALTYVGQYDPVYEFVANIASIEAPRLK